MNRNFKSIMQVLIFSLGLTFFWMGVARLFHWEQMIAQGFWGTFLCSFLGAGTYEVLKRFRQYYADKKVVQQS